MIYFTSDHHFYHQNIIKYCNRPFNSVEEMNEEMVKRWNEVVKPDDIVYYLGDFSLAIRPVELYLNRLNGIKHLIAGNHDFCHPAHPKSKTFEREMKWIETYKQLGFESVALMGEYESPSFIMTHMPYLTVDNQDERYPQYRPKDEGKWLLHGHVHMTWKTKDKMINVGVDVWDFYPVSLEQIINIIKEYEIKEFMNENSELMDALGNERNINE